MRLTYKIAFRNLFRHKGRSIAIGFVLFTGTFCMTLGNGTITGMKKSMERNLSRAFAVISHCFHRTGGKTTWAIA